jgi:hypothetical protein
LKITFLRPLDHTVIKAFPKGADDNHTQQTGICDKTPTLGAFLNPQNGLLQLKQLPWKGEPPGTLMYNLGIHSDFQIRFHLNLGFG